MEQNPYESPSALPIEPETQEQYEHKTMVKAAMSLPIGCAAALGLGTTGISALMGITRAHIRQEDIDSWTNASIAAAIACGIFYASSSMYAMFQLLKGETRFRSSLKSSKK
ncbi:hypothetical protein A3D88_01225 [Candidatus Peribacteria bacterium RIFCSPHIGHO2_02_FULL_52_16]|nr:MAG: hypothetical protein A2706_05950 [Candidatus Peribacteria bacterium RIFCSPHIGHO2_01_FULL_51_35]OGJ61285.1 MAG: hypothetical protein A3D88_01225 [Candidatus Peribacteria bacterium RIFCSPHIGHO2_02_FULL_52_16]